MYRRSAQPSNNLSERKKLFGSTPDVLDVTDNQDKDSRALPDSSLSPPNTATSPKPAHDSEKKSRVSAMSQMFENKTKEHLGLRTNVDLTKNKATTKTAGVTATAEIKQSTSPEIKHEPKKDNSEKVSKAADSKKSSPPRSPVESPPTKQHHEVTNHKDDDVKEELPSLLKSLANAKQHKPVNNEVNSDTKSTLNLPETDSVEDDKKEILPSLLSSLVDVKKGDVIPGKQTQAESRIDDASSTNPFAPLISELPKVPEARPR